MTDPHFRFSLIRRPEGAPTRDDFLFGEVPVSPLETEQFRVAVKYISLDPAMRGWMTDLPSYIPPVKLGSVMRAFGVGEVLESLHSGFPEGSLGSGMVGVQNQCITTGRGFSRIQRSEIPLSAYVGPLGIPGLSAYFGLLDVARPEPGHTVLVSGAAGAVGSMVGQLAKMKGCRVVGIAGGPEKCAHLLDDLGFDGAIDYKNERMKRAIRRECPDGVDIYFDNVGGEILNAALGWLTVGARVVICGAISQYNATSLPPGPSNYLALLVRRATMQGFIVLDYVDRYEAAIREMSSWIQEGKIQYRETIIDGLDTFPETFMRLFSGDKIGKLALRV